MPGSLSRRMFLFVAPAFGLASEVARTQTTDGANVASSTFHESFPSQEPAQVREMVTVSHFDVKRVRELVAKRPALARASWDWGFGDWETALGAASHMGNREIAEVLLANGAHATIFSAVMLGQLDAVKAFIAAVPGIQKTRGPHGITLLAHAKAGGAAAAGVLKFLETIGDADIRYTDEPLTDAERAALTGSYVFGAGPRDRFTIAVDKSNALTIERPGGTVRRLFHQGSRVFLPAGAETVRIRFEAASGPATALALTDGDVSLTATR